MINEDQQALGRLAKEVGVTSMDFAALLNVPSSTIRCWMSGHALMPSHHLRAARVIVAERLEAQTTAATTSTTAPEGSHE